MSTQKLPEHIGGFQHLQPDVIAKEDDIFVRAGIVRGFVSSDYAGQTVAALEAEFKGWRIYRKIPCPRQGGDRPLTQEERDALALAEVKAVMQVEAKKRGVIVARALERNTLPTDAKARKGIPIYSGFIKYFPLAIAEVARVSQAGNEQHNPGKPLHWDRSKSGDELDALGRHFLDAEKFDTDGQRHSAKIAWRAMANLQKELEEEQKK